MYKDPHQLLEGMIISCFANDVRLAYIYIRGEMVDGAKILNQALKEARAKNFLGKDILGSGYDLEMHVHRGAGAYICGEETGLIESLEGKRPYPRIKPPYFPAVLGLYQCPTIVNNVETLATVKHIDVYKRQPEHGAFPPRHPRRAQDRARIGRRNHHQSHAGHRLSAPRRRKDRREHDLQPVHPVHRPAGFCLLYTSRCV